MSTINVTEAKAHLSDYLDQGEAGQIIVICRRNVPIAELRTAFPSVGAPRHIGLMKGRFDVPDTFFESLDESVLAAFEGR